MEFAKYQLIPCLCHFCVNSKPTWPGKVCKNLEQV